MIFGFHFISIRITTNMKYILSLCLLRSPVKTWKIKCCSYKTPSGNKRNRKKNCNSNKWWFPGSRGSVTNKLKRWEAALWSLQGFCHCCTAHRGVKCDHGGLPVHIRTWQMKRWGQWAETQHASSITIGLRTLEGKKSLYSPVSRWQNGHSLPDDNTESTHKTYL